MQFFPKFKKIYSFSNKDKKLDVFSSSEYQSFLNDEVQK